MNKNKLLYVLLIFLFVVNGFLLYNQFAKKGHRGQKGSQNGRVEFIVKELQFNDSQKEELDKIYENHRSKMKIIGNDIIQLKESLFNRNSDSSLTTLEIDSITSIISVKDKEKYIEYYHHFRAIRELCNEQQKEKFEEIIRGALRKKGRRGGNGQRR